MSEQNSSNGRAFGTAFDEFVVGDLIEDIEFVEELIAEAWLIEKRRSSRQGSLLVVVANITRFVLWSANERDPIFFLD